MKSPHLSISHLMSLVLLIALNLAACKAVMVPPIWGGPRSELIVFGAFPMANVLGIGLILFLKARPNDVRRRSRLLGFEVGGTAALGLFLGCSLLAPQAMHEAFGSVFQAMRVQPGPLKALGVTVLILLLQVAAGLLGGWLNRTYQIRATILVSRREFSRHEQRVAPDRLLASGRS